MQIKTLLAATAFIATSMAWTIPENQPDGSYSVYKHENGTYIHERIGDVPAKYTRTPLSAKITKRRTLTDDVICDPNRVELDHGATDAANQGVDDQCYGGRYVDAHMSIYTKVGDVVAYFCSNSGKNNCWCSPQDRGRASSMITGGCGYYMSGWKYETGAHCTYGYRPKNDNFCPGP